MSRSTLVRYSTGVGKRSDPKLLETVPSSPCPHCGRQLDAAAHAGKGFAYPKPGDVSLCVKCNGLLRFDQNLHLRALPYAEFLTLPAGLRNRLLGVQNRLNGVQTNERIR